jgi:sugar/nucleoside kinase (ribokinase family)
VHTLKPPQKLLGVVGDLVEDVIVVPGGPSERGTDNPSAISRQRGGSAANVAALAAASTAVRFIGCVGDDAAGASLERDLSSLGVDVRVQRRGRTGTVVVLVDPDGERTMFPDRGASALLDIVDESWTGGLDFLHVCAYSLATEPGRRVIADLGSRVRAGGGGISIDLSAASLITSMEPDRFAALVAELVPSIVFANHDEMDALGTSVAILRRAATIVVKNGARATSILQPNGTVRTVDVAPVADVVDTTGAGDAFAAGYLSAWLAGRDVEASCRRGHSCAATVLGHAGAGGQRLSAAATFAESQ